MSSMSDYLENKSLDHCLGTATFTKPSATYLALFTSDPGDTGTVGEVSATGYARQLMTWNAASGGTASNSGTATFGPAVTAFGTVGYWALYDAAVGGNMLYRAAVTTPKTVAVGDLATFLPNDLTVTHQ